MPRVTPTARGSPNRCSESGASSQTIAVPASAAASPIQKPVLL
jgi:hypothetical protein